MIERAKRQKRKQDEKSKVCLLSFCSLPTYPHRLLSGYSVASHHHSHTTRRHFLVLPSFFSPTMSNTIPLKTLLKKNKITFVPVFRKQNANLACDFEGFCLVSFTILLWDFVVMEIVGVENGED